MLRWEEWREEGGSGVALVGGNEKPPSLLLVLLPSKSAEPPHELDCSSSQDWPVKHNTD